MHVLVTGGTGFVGSHSVRALVDEGHTVRMFVRDPARIGPALEPLGVDSQQVEVAVGDVTDEAAAAAAVAGCEGVLHCASVYGFGRAKREAIRRVNVAGTKIMLEAGLAAGCNPVIHVSSVVALSGPPNKRGAVLRADSPLRTDRGGVYTRSKRDSDALARALQDSGAPVVISYPGGVWGPHDPHLGESSQIGVRTARGRLRATTRRGFCLVDVRDLAMVHARAMRPHDGPARYPAFGRYIRNSDLTAEIFRAAGKRRWVLTIPGFMLAPSAGLYWLGERLGIRTAVSSEQIRFVARDNRGDNTASEALGVSFRKPEPSIRDTVAWLVDHGELPQRPPLLEDAAP